ncbi:MAG: 50S ribosomal protein L5 [Patescibacteria group bacterium]
MEKVFDKKIITEKLKKDLGYKNIHQVPQIKTVSVNIGIGKALSDKSYLEFATDVIEKITGQKAQTRITTKSISNFKTRAGMIVGTRVTLRSSRMVDFIQRLVRLALPRIKDFRGLSLKSFDKTGNYSIGIKDFRIFPEVYDVDFTKTLSLQVNISTTAKNAKEGEELLRAWNFPLKKTR